MRCFFRGIVAWTYADLVTTVLLETIPAPTGTARSGADLGDARVDTTVRSQRARELVHLQALLMPEEGLEPPTRGL